MPGRRRRRWRRRSTARARLPRNLRVARVGWRRLLMSDWRTHPTRRRQSRRWRAGHGCGGRAYSRLASGGFEGLVHDLGKSLPGQAAELAVGLGPVKRTLADLDLSEDRFVAPPIL